MLKLSPKKLRQLGDAICASNKIIRSINRDYESSMDLLRRIYGQRKTKTRGAR